MTRAFVWDEGRVLEHLGDLVAEAPIGNRPLSAHQDDALDQPTRIRNLSDIPADAREFVLVRGHVWLTRSLVQKFVRAAQKSGTEVAALALGPCVFARTTTALADVRKDGERTVYGVWWCAKAPVTQAGLDAATPVVVEILEHKIPNDMLARRGVQNDAMDVALTTEAILHVRHWSHLVVANYVSMFHFWFKLSPRKVMRYLWAVLRACPWPSAARISRTLTVRGRRCKIHPSAVVETSILGDRVEICAGAVVRGSIIGNDVKIDVHANVNNSSIGDAAVVSFQTLCNLNVMYPQSMLSHIGTQMGVIGRRASVLGGSLLMDLRDPYLERDVMVTDGGQRVPSGRRVLGPCIGHDAVVGADVKLSPGMEVPAGAYLVTDPNGVIRRIEKPPEARVPHRVHDGGIVPARKR
jgi:carbonic anhydrase/acetyltransferase-like protein (isoleucine patch superfamily)